MSLDRDAAGVVSAALRALRKPRCAGPTAAELFTAVQEAEQLLDSIAPRPSGPVPPPPPGPRLECWSLADIDAADLGAYIRLFGAAQPQGHLTEMMISFTEDGPGFGRTLASLTLTNSAGREDVLEGVPLSHRFDYLDPETKTTIPQERAREIAAQKKATQELNEKYLDQVQRRINNCRSYNFGMADADRLAHDDADRLVAEIRRLRELTS